MSDLRTFLAEVKSTRAWAGREDLAVKPVERWKSITKWVKERDLDFPDTETMLSFIVNLLQGYPGTNRIKLTVVALRVTVRVGLDELADITEVNQLVDHIDTMYRDCFYS